MQSEIKCIVCNGVHFREGYFETEYDRYHEDYQINEKTEMPIGLRLHGQNSLVDDYSDLFTYICEDCGFIMNFTKEKNVISKFQKRKQNEKENTDDWTNFK